MSVLSDADAHEIITGLWIGNERSSQNETFLRSHHIDVVFNCTKTLPFHNLIAHKYRLPVDDNLREEEIRNMELWSSDVAYKMMHEYLAGNRILVHCHAGMQRSAAAVAIFLIAFKRMRADEAMVFIKQKRPIAFHGGANFERAIRYFENVFLNKYLPVIDAGQGQGQPNSKFKLD
jgi:hypothetical protein